MWWPFKKKDQRKHPKERAPSYEQISPMPPRDPDDEYVLPPYYAKVIRERDHGGPYWSTLWVGVFERVEDGEDKQVGEYVRNYHSLMQTFFPFERNGKWYALYSKDYTSTRVMTLPDCKDIGGEESNKHEFCPVEFFVPKVYRCRRLNPKEKDSKKLKFEHSPAYVPFGLVSGCVWGDDSSWKIQYLDLSQVDKGIIKREEKFGYIELPNSLHLSEAIGEVFDWNQESTLPDNRHCYQYSIACSITFRVYPDGKMAVFGKEHIANSTTEE